MNKPVLDPALPDVTLIKPQSLERSNPIQVQIHIRLSAPAVAMTYSESAYQWLVEVLDGLIDFGKRHGHYGVMKLTEEEYQWLDDVLEELICSVGENENHPLAPLMDFIIQLIDNYEKTYVPELTELFPELVEETPIETMSENRHQVADTAKLGENELAAYAFFSIGYLLYQGKQTEKALSAYDIAIALKPNFWEASYNQGIARSDLGQYMEAIANLNTTIELKPDFASAYHNRGTLKSELKDYKGAIADFNKAIMLKSDHADAYNKLGIAKLKLGHHDAAIVDFNKAIELKPEIAETYYCRGFAKNQLGSSQDAIGDYDKAIELGYNSAEVYLDRGSAKKNSGQHDNALIDYTEAIHIKPDYAEAYANNGVAKAHLSRINEAKYDFQTALELADQQGKTDSKAQIEKRLQEFIN